MGTIAVFTKPCGACSMVIYLADAARFGDVEITESPRIMFRMLSSFSYV